MPELPSPPILLPASVERPVPDPGNRRPLYPEAQRARDLEARVYLKVVVSAAGVVEDVQVLAGDPAFADSALAAARDWRFSPTLVAGRPTAVSFVVKVPFQPSGR
jgi:protein TonB